MPSSTSDAVSLDTSGVDGVLLAAGLEFAVSAVSALQSALAGTGRAIDAVVTAPADGMPRDGLLVSCRAIDGMWANVRQHTPMALATCDPWLPDRTVLALGDGKTPYAGWSVLSDLTPAQAARSMLSHFATYHADSPESQGGGDAR